MSLLYPQFINQIICVYIEEILPRMSVRSEEALYAAVGFGESYGSGEAFDGGGLTTSLT